MKSHDLVREGAVFFFLLLLSSWYLHHPGSFWIMCLRNSLVIMLVFFFEIIFSGKSGIWNFWIKYNYWNSSLRRRSVFSVQMRIRFASWIHGYHKFRWSLGFSTFNYNSLVGIKHLLNAHSLNKRAPFSMFVLSSWKIFVEFSVSLIQL